MTIRRFSKEELFAVRNLIPIDALIGSVLGIPTMHEQNTFRFLCPLCGGFHTATNQETNLARCFHCKQNFNPIDIVMRCRGVGFVESVLFLKDCQSKHLTADKMLTSRRPCRHLTAPLSVAEILKDIAVGHQLREQAWK